MQKKVFLQRNPRKGGGGRSPYVKYLLMAALGLMLLVLITPYLLNQRGRDGGRRTLAEKGMLKKDLPKPPEAAPGEIPSTADKAPGAIADKPESPQPSEPPKPPEPATSGSSIEPVPPVLPLEQPQTAKPQPEPAPRDLFPKKASPGATASVTQKPPSAPPAARQESKPRVVAPGAPGAPGAPADSTAKQAMKGKPVPGAKGMYSVQVGCYKEKQSAEEVRRSLQKKGYDVVLCPSNSGSYAYTVVTRAVPSMSKAATLSEQIKSEQKVSPVIIKAPLGCELPARQPAATPVIDKKALKPAAVKPPQTTQAKPPVKPVTKATLPAKAPVKQKTAVPAEKRQPAPPAGN